MTTTTPETIAITATPPEGRRSRLRFLAAFLVGLAATVVLGAAALFAFDQQYQGRILPGVRIGALDLSGLEPAAAAEALRTEFAVLGEGALVLTGPDGDHTIAYADIGRGPDVDAMIAEAMAIGRDGNPVERVIADARTAIRGATISPRVTFDPEALANELSTFAASLAIEPRDAAVILTEGQGFMIRYGANGRTTELEGRLEAALAAITSVDAPARVEIDVPTRVIPPTTTTDEARAAWVLADRMTARITIDIGEESPAISADRLRSWTTFAVTPDGGYAPTLDTAKIPDLLTYLAKRIDRDPKNASYTATGGKITGVVKSRDGRTLDVPATFERVEAVLAERMGGAAPASVEPALAIVAPALTTEEAEAARPKMRMVSEWTTFFPVSEKNGQGANIWIPARLIDGYVVAPGATFDFWQAVGPVTREKGYKDGGAIINGKTEPQGALAGGICSCSTTLFNAALRAGYEMGSRRNHYYYIDRYPLGLDATVFISASGATQTMSFTNDTDYPILIRGAGWNEGSSGYVRFRLYSVPTGRDVTFSKPIVQNVRRATDTVQYTTSLPAGTSKRIEYPVDGKQVTVTRTVRDRSGAVIHRNTYFSNYARITGLTLIGKAAD